MTLIDENLSTEVLSKMSHEMLVERIINYKERYESLAEEFDEYKSSSQEMEQIMEGELQVAQKAKTKAENERNLTRTEADRITVRYETTKRDSFVVEETLRNELSSIRSSYELARSRIRQLEQANDDLERRERNHAQMLEDLTKELERMIERSAILESDLAEQQFQSESAIRIREEMRSERPRVAVEPLRVERVNHTPDETPEQERKAFASMTIEDTHMEVDDHCASSSYGQPNGVPLPLTPDSSHGGTPGPDAPIHEETAKPTTSNGRKAPGAFMHSLNKIVKDLLVRVDRVENVLTTINHGNRL